MNATIEITPRLGKGYNIWQKAELALPKNELTNYSSDWVIIGVAPNNNRALFFVKEYQEGVTS